MPFSDRYRTLADQDKRYVWHPFTQMQTYCEDDPLIIERGEGIFLYDVDDHRYYDGVSSIWLNVHGHRVPEIDAAIREQLDKIAHSTLLGSASEPSIRLAEQLVELTPPGLNHVFYSDSGAESVEIGLKMAYQHWHHLGEPERRLFIAMGDAYHGDTIGAVSVGGMELFHGAFRDLIFPTLRAPYPHPYRFAGDAEACRDHCLGELEALLREHRGKVCGVILEPLVEGAAGIVTMPEGFLRGAAALCREHDTLLITDEVATGFGRTGRMFACEHEDVRPDILMTAKGITGGYLPLAATLTTDRVYNAFLGEYAERKTFFHGHSYTGNQLGCAAALANIRLFKERRIVDHVTSAGATIAGLLDGWREHPHVGDVRGRGFMWGIELVADAATGQAYPYEAAMGAQVCRRARDLGLLVRPLGDVLVFMPPLASTDDQLEAMLTLYYQALNDITLSA